MTGGFGRDAPGALQKKREVTIMAESPVRPIPWRAGHLRAEAEASACRYAAVELFVKIGERPVGGLVDLAGAGAGGGTPAGRGGALVERFLAEMPELGVVCHSPELAGALGPRLPLELRRSLTRLRVTLEICRRCPFFELPAAGTGL